MSHSLSACRNFLIDQTQQFLENGPWVYSAWLLPRPLDATQPRYLAPLLLVRQGGGSGNLSGGNRVQNSPQRLCRCWQGQLVEDLTLPAGQTGGMDHTTHALP